MALVAIVGRPNVGKSTLFNRIAGRRHALVDDFPGVTRDRNYANVTWEGKIFQLVDTAGYVSTEGTSLEEQTREQVLVALEEADIILFTADVKTGIHPEDTALVNILRRTSKPVFYAVNKVDSPEQAKYMAEFYELGLDHFYPISSAHGFGIGDLMSDIVDTIPGGVEEGMEEGEEGEEGEGVEREIRVSIVGRPNVGKSTLVNQILGEPRVIVSPIPGTTRDAVDSPFVHTGRRYVLIDTAGIRRKGKTHAKMEKLSILKALQAVERSHVAILVLDATEGVTDQDLHISGYVQERSRACIIAVNKWDAMDLDPKRAKQYMADLRDRFRFLTYAPVVTISALTGTRVRKLIPTVHDVFQQYNQRITTGVVNRALEQALQHHEPPQPGGRPLKFYYATQASTRPPTFVLFCNHPEAIHFSYERYLTNQLRAAFGLDKSPLRLVFRGRERREKG